jgi:hypothetical protein
LTAFGILFFFAGHRLESMLIPLELAFEHRNDLPSLGLILAAADLIGSATGTLARFRPMIAAVALLALFSLGLARSWVWGMRNRFRRFPTIWIPVSVGATEVAPTFEPMVSAWYPVFRKSP